MPISDETLNRIIAEYGGFELSSEELELVKPELGELSDRVAEPAES